jgi:hypothetical protein
MCYTLPQMGNNIELGVLVFNIKVENSKNY